MRLIKEISFAATLSLAALFSTPWAGAQEIKAGDITISHPWSRQSPMAANVAAGFMTITNSGSADDRLIAATAEISSKVQLHDMRMDGDVMKMFEVEGGIVIPAGQTVELKPRALHVMFMDTTASPKKGESFKGTLTFEKAGSIDITYEVKDAMEGMH
jgi:copper(I)-binding protein